MTKDCLLLRCIAAAGLAIAVDKPFPNWYFGRRLEYIFGIPSQILPHRVSDAWRSRTELRPATGILAIGNVFGKDRLDVLLVERRTVDHLHPLVCGRLGTMIRCDEADALAARPQRAPHRGSFFLRTVVDDQNHR